MTEIDAEALDRQFDIKTTILFSLVVGGTILVVPTFAYFFGYSWFDWTMFFLFSDVGRVFAEFKLNKKSNAVSYENRFLLRQLKLIWIFHLTIYPFVLFDFPTVIKVVFDSFLLQDMIILQASLFFLLSY